MFLWITFSQLYLWPQPYSNWAHLLQEPFVETEDKQPQAFRNRFKVGEKKS
jgi:hypothetical protein